MITYCILRNYEGLPEEVGNDIDIWIKDRDQEKFQKILFEIAKETDWEIILYSPRFSYYRNYFFAKQSKRLNILHIDCWTFLYWKSISYIDESVFQVTIVLGLLNKKFILKNTKFEELNYRKRLGRLKAKIKNTSPEIIQYPYKVATPPKIQE